MTATRNIGVDRMFWIKKDLVQPDFLDLMKIELTKAPKSYSDEKPPVIFWKEDDTTFFMPRQYGAKLFLNKYEIDDNRSEPKADIPFIGKLREKQEPFCNQLHKNLLLDGFGAMGIAYCGFGKTICGAWLAHRLGLRTLILCHKEFLMNQWIEAFVKFCGIQPGIIRKDRCETDGPVSVAMIASLHSRRYTGIYDKFGLVILDEMQHASAETFASAIQAFSAKYVVGLTATPRRKDGMEVAFEWLIGLTAAIAKRGKTAGKVHILNWREPIVKDYIIKFGVRKGTTNTAKLLTDIGRNVRRTRWLLGPILDAYKAGRQGMILSHRRAHLYAFSEMLENDGYGDQYGFYMGEKRVRLRTDDELKAIRDKAKNKGKKLTAAQKDPYIWRTMKQNELDESAEKPIILATYGQAKEGLDIKTLNALFLATPEGDVEQSVGRVMRSSNPVIVDVVDQHPSCLRYLERRMKFYAKEGLVVKS